MRAGSPTIRPMTADDLDEVARLEHEVEVTPWSRSGFEDALTHHRRTVVLENDGRIAAWAVLMPVVDETELLILGTAKAAQRKGFATALMRHEVDCARADGMVRMHLEVRASNAPAIGLYEKLGFERVGLRKGYYLVDGQREDAVLMCLEITKNGGEDAR